MSQRRRKDQMFERTSQVLKGLEVDERHGVIVCPLCRRGVCRDCGFGKSGLLEEEHAPQKLFGSAMSDARCLTCAKCNHAFGDDIERRTAPRISARQASHSCSRFATFTPTTDGLLVPNCSRAASSHGLELALDQLQLPLQVEPEERLIELRSAFLVAFAALGHSYVMGTGGDQVRAILDSPPSAAPIRTCLILQTSAHIPSKAVLVLTLPAPAVLVVHPSPHCTSGTHAVLLPPANHTGRFYDEWQLAPISRFEITEVYPWPGPRQLPMHWDVCLHQHPRITQCFGVAAEDAQHKVHYGWKHYRAKKIRSQRNAAA